MSRSLPLSANLAAVLLLVTACGGGGGGNSADVRPGPQNAPAPAIGVRSDLPFKEAKGQLVDRFGQPCLP